MTWITRVKRLINNGDTEGALDFILQNEDAMEIIKK